MLIRTSCHTTEVHLARIVIPRSRSSSFESRARSATCWLARNAPLWRSIASTKVVLPWSTWAMIAMLRMSIKCKTSPAHSGARDHQAAGVGQELGQVDLRAVTEMPGDFGSAQTADLAANGKRHSAGQGIREAPDVKIALPGGIDRPSRAGARFRRTGKNPRRPERGSGPHTRSTRDS